MSLALAALGERYRFAKMPPASAYLNRPLELKFEGGSFDGADGKAIWVNVSIHDDGFIAETRASTIESDRFLTEALSWLSETYSLPQASELEIDRIYASELLVQLELPPSIFTERFQTFVRRMAQGTSNNPGVPMDFLGLYFGPDPTRAKRPAPFKMERLAGVAFNKKQYYTVAPVGTADHIEILEAMENAAV
jgi:hypothetical protein